MTGAREAFTKALSYGMACGNDGVVQEAEAFLGQTQDQSTVDQDAFLWGWACHLSAARAQPLASCS